jgi:hypothetical protein
MRRAAAPPRGVGVSHAAGLQVLHEGRDHAWLPVALDVIGHGATGSASVPS